MHCGDTTEASVLAHEIVTARPYAFLDDEEPRTGAPTRCSCAGACRRPVDHRRLDPDAIDRVRAEIAPEPRTADDLHDLLLGLVVPRPGPPGGRCSTSSPAPGGLRHRRRHRAVVRGRGGGGAGAVFEDRPTPTPRWCRSRRAAGPPRAGRPSRPPSWPTAARCQRRVAFGLAALEQKGFALQGRYRPRPAPTRRVVRPPAPGPHAHLLPQHPPRGVEPVTAEDFVRFLLRWQHVAPGTQLRGRPGAHRRARAAPGLRGRGRRVGARVPPPACADYDPAQLDRLCHDGDVAWLRLSPRRAPTAARPVEGHADHGGPPGRPAVAAAAARGDAVPDAPTVGATAEVVEVLRARGARFVADLAAATGRLPADVEEALWDGVARGLLTADGFAAIRARVEAGRHRPAGPLGAPSGRGAPRRTGRRAVGAGPGARAPPTGTSWPRRSPSSCSTAGAWCSATSPCTTACRLPWRDLQWALRRFEDRGLVRGGRFVAGVAGEQYALPAAVEQLAHVRRRPRTGERVTVNATDPLNLVGVLVPGHRIPAVRTNTVTYVDGLPGGAEPIPLTLTATGATVRARPAHPATVVQRLGRPHIQRRPVSSRLRRRRHPLTADHRHRPRRSPRLHTTSARDDLGTPLPASTARNGGRSVRPRTFLAADSDFGLDSAAFLPGLTFTTSASSILPTSPADVQLFLQYSSTPSGSWRRGSTSSASAQALSIPSRPSILARPAGTGRLTFVAMSGVGHRFTEARSSARRPTSLLAGEGPAPSSSSSSSFPTTSAS